MSRETRDELFGKLLRTEEALDELTAQNARLREAILDIDRHSTPLGEDAEGFSTTGYYVSVGSLHRALGLVNGSIQPEAAR